MSDKRSVHTDALATLGTLTLDETAGRDAIHLAVEPVTSDEILQAGDHVGIVNGKASMTAEKKLGIVDPFVSGYIEPGTKFWLIIYPRTITSLRHVWEHPDFVDKTLAKKSPETEFEISQAWIMSFADRIDQTYNQLMRAADTWVEQADYTYDNSETYKNHWDEFEEFWKHYEVVRGVKVYDHKEVFFTCSC